MLLRESTRIWKRIGWACVLCILLTGIWGELRGQTRECDSLMKVMRKGDYPAALMGLVALDKKYPNNDEIRLALGMAYNLNEEYDKSVEAYNQAILAKGVSVDHLKAFGTSLLFVGRFTDAMGTFHEILRQKPYDTECRRLTLLADSLEKLFTSHPSYEILLLPFNTPGPESAPSVHAGNLALCKVSTDGTGLGAFVSEINRRGDKYSFFRPLSLSHSHADGWDEGALSWDAASNMVAVTRRSAASKLDRIWPDSAAPLKIFFYGLDDEGKLENLTGFPENTGQYSNGFPCFADAGKYLLFASDRPGGMGGFDLYICAKSGNSWSPAVNLGPEVNTPGNEIYPFLHPDGTLYWSCDYYKSNHDLDIYEALPDSGIITPDLFAATGKSLFRDVHPMGESINSASDDYAFVMEENRRHGFFCSNRAGGAGGDDIYALVIREIETECSAEKPEGLCFQFYDNNNVSQGPSYPYKFEWDFGDGASALAEKPEHCYTTTGDYLVKYTITDPVTGNVVSSSESVISAQMIPQAVIRGSNKSKVHQKAQFSGAKSHLLDEGIIRYQWDFGDGQTGTGVEVSHAYHTPGRYTVRLRIAGISKDMAKIDRKCTTIEVEVTE